MPPSNVTTAREALMAELLQDVDALLRRVEQLDQGLSARVEQAVKDAAGKAFLSTKLTFESTISEQERKLVQSAQRAGAQLGSLLGSQTAQLVAVGATLKQGALRAFLLVMGGALLGGVLGGFIGAKLAGLL